MTYDGRQAVPWSGFDDRVAVAAPAAIGPYLLAVSETRSRLGSLSVGAMRRLALPACTGLLSSLLPLLSGCQSASWAAWRPSRAALAAAV